MTEQINLTPTRPYMLRAIYQWLEDNELTPYLMVDATHEHAKVPVEYIQDGRIVLNIATQATGNLEMDNDFIFFKARFGGVSQEVWVPLPAVMGIYAKEDTQVGMFFNPQEYDNYTLPEKNEAVEKKAKSSTARRSRPRRENKAGLKILK